MPENEEPRPVDSLIPTNRGSIFRYSPESGQWHYHYYKNNRDSTKMFELLPKLSAAIQTKQQFEEQGAASPEVPAAADEDEQDMEL